MLGWRKRSKLPLGRLLAVALLAGVWLLASGPAAGAHALVRSSDPASGATLARAPGAVVVVFSEPPDPRLSTMRVLDAGGRPVDQGKAGVVPATRSPCGSRLARCPMAPTR